MQTLLPSHPPLAAASPVVMKHWRAFGDAEWRHVQEGAQGLLLGSALPVVLFYAALRAWTFLPAVGVVLLWSALVFGWHWRRTGGADVFSAVTFGFACVHALIGFASRDPYLYLAAPSLENLLVAVALLGSAVVGRPLLALYAQRLYPIPSSVQDSATFRRAFLVTSGVWAAGLLTRAVVRLWLLSLWQAGLLPLEWYLVVNTVSGWPINLALAGFTVWYPLRALRRAGLMAHTPPLRNVEQSVEEVALGTP